MHNQHREISSFLNRLPEHKQREAIRMGITGTPFLCARKACDGHCDAYLHPDKKWYKKLEFPTKAKVAAVTPLKRSSKKSRLPRANPASNQKPASKKKQTPVDPENKVTHRLNELKDKLAIKKGYVYVLLLLNKSDFVPGTTDVDACRFLNQSKNRNIVVPYYIGKSCEPHFAGHHERNPELSGPAKMASSGQYFVIQIALFETASREESSQLESLLIVSSTVASFLIYIACDKM